MKNVIKLTTLILSVILCLSFSVGCNNDSNAPETNTPSTSQAMTSSRAVSIVKNSNTVINKIASTFKLKFYYDPDWGTTEVDEWNGEFTVRIRGTISGYLDDYKTRFEYNLKFIVTAYVRADGSIYGLTVYKT